MAAAKMFSECMLMLIIAGTFTLSHTKGIIEIKNEKELEDNVAANMSRKLGVIYFYTEKTAPNNEKCKAASDFYEKLAHEDANAEVYFLRVNIDELSSDMNIKANEVPAFNFIVASSGEAVFKSVDDEDKYTEVKEFIKNNR